MAKFYRNGIFMCQKRLQQKTKPTFLRVIHRIKVFPTPFKHPCGINTRKNTVAQSAKTTRPPSIAKAINLLQPQISGYCCFMWLPCCPSTIHLPSPVVKVCYVTFNKVCNVYLLMPLASTRMSGHPVVTPD